MRRDAACRACSRSRAKNLEATDSVAMFEVGSVYVPKTGEKLPDEPRRLAVVLCGRRIAGAWDDPQGVKPARPTSST